MELTFSHKYIKKKIYIQNDSHRTTTEDWQKTPDCQKVKKKKNKKQKKTKLYITG